ncbi:alkene reductase [Burkholderia multivorans]|uniref:Alkene reductase n=1 Tax=Burkholderia multivorans TaxID=87883 RepID=A0AAP2MN04_9BURK|nr:alkene reductase [Burkholderia multivorans]MBU9356114.1 alkene reductase [Burkholderia multivorans]MBU9366502.1 alkene reductase [Burkholderia multivorans]MBU9597084.1 alkene reductase [Burkholderia multivorans]MCA8488078.1 alkene reductase [Burkholderia multivorans]
MTNQLNALFSTHRLGSFELKNRMVMAPMTRSRAVEANLVHPLAPVYYAQRAAAGLMISEATQVSHQGAGYVRTPGIHSPEQVAAWRRVTDAVHAAGGIIFAQLWHVGRVSHPEFHRGALPVAPSALSADAEVFISTGLAPTPVPRALDSEEIVDVVGQFRRAAQNANEAGFDGVEIHGSSGYLLNQFLRDGSNVRTDQYGGSIANRARFPLEVAAAVVDVLGGERVGYRIGPNMTLHAMSDSTPVQTFSYLAAELDRLGIAYLHVTEGVAGPDAPPPGIERVAPYLRKAFSRSLILNGGFDADSGDAAITRGEADLIAYGVPFLANPDLPERYRLRAPLNMPDYASFYEPGEDDAIGYIDYPALNAFVAKGR